MNSLEWLEVLVSFSIQVAILTAVTFAIDRLCTASKQQSALWTTCFLCILGLFAAAILLPHAKLFHPWNSLEPTQLMLVAGTEHWLGLCLLAVWLLGSGVSFVVWMINTLNLHREIRRYEKFSPADLEVVWQAIGDPCPTVDGRAVRFFYCDDETGPFCYQLHRPSIFIPKFMLARLTSGGQLEGLKHIVCHELTHLATEHPMQLFLQRLLQCLFWFHPMVRFTGRRASLVREYVCDDVASDNGVQTLSYLRTLLDVTESRHQPRPGTLSIRRSRSELVDRVQRLARTYSAAAGTGSARPASIAIRFALCGPILATVAVSLCWLPLNPLASSKSHWSPWPTWSAACLHEVGINALDFEQFDRRCDIHELWTERGDNG